MAKTSSKNEFFFIDEEYISTTYGVPTLEAKSFFENNFLESNINPNEYTDTEYILERWEISSLEDYSKTLNRKDCKPSHKFDPNFYYETNEDVKQANYPAFRHYLLFGKKEGRLPTPGFQKPVNKKRKIKLAHIQDSWDSTYILNHLEQTVQLKDDEVPVRPSTKKVIIIAELNIPQCKKYRVMQKVEYFNRIGVECKFTHWEDVPRALNLIQNASTLILYRIPFCQLTNLYIQEAKRLNIEIGYDIDDPIFDTQIYRENDNIYYLNDGQITSLLSGSSLYETVIKMADFTIGSTPKMVELLKKINPNRSVLWRNVLDSEAFSAMKFLKETDSKPQYEDTFNIIYMCGSKAHEGDSAQVIGPLYQIMSENENVRLRVVGNSKNVHELKYCFDDRVTILPFTNYFDYIKYFIGAHLNIIPLLQNQFNDSKSAIRFLEGSLTRVATAVNSIGDFKNIIKHGITGFLVQDESEWYDTIMHAIQNKEQLKEIAENAYHDVIKDHSIQNLVTELDFKLN